MDVLHFLKTQHDLLRDGLTRVEGADGIKARRMHLEEMTRMLNVHLVIEKDYLYPELVDLFPGSDALVTAGLASGSTIGRRLKTLVKLAAKPVAEQEGYGKRLVELKESLLKHFDQEEQILMPKIRSLIRTEDREDLGQVFLDAKAELAVGAEPAAPQVAAPANGRKRA